MFLLTESTVTSLADGSLRLVGGSTEASGTLEIFHEGYWGSVCDDSWNGLASTVACKQLGYRNFNAFSMRNTLTTDVWLDDVVCIGNEEYLSNCSNSGWGTHNCGSLEGVKLDCIPYGKISCLDRFDSIKILNSYSYYKFEI